MTQILTTVDELAAVVRTAVADALKGAPAPRADDDLLTVGEAADLLNVSTDTVKRWTRAGHLAARQFGRVKRYRRADVLARLNVAR